MRFQWSFLRSPDGWGLKRHKCRAPTRRLARFVHCKHSAIESFWLSCFVVQIRLESRKIVAYQGRSRCEGRSPISPVTLQKDESEVLELQGSQKSTKARQSGDTRKRLEQEETESTEPFHSVLSVISCEDWAVANQRLAHSGALWRSEKNMAR